MKKTILLLVAFISFIHFINAQNPTYECKITNAAQVSCNSYEFDIQLCRTGTSLFKLATFQCGITINPALIPSNGIISVSMLPGSSNLWYPPTNAQFSYDAVYNCIKITQVTPPGAGNAQQITDSIPGERLCRVKVSCSLPFVSGINPGHTWNFSTATGFPTKMFAYTGAGYTTLSDITVPASHILTGTYNPVIADLTDQKLTGITPNHGQNGSVATATITGKFNNVLGVKLTKPWWPDVILTYNLNSTLACGNEITATLNLNNMGGGYWNLVVTTLDTTMILPNAFRIDSLCLLNIYPSSGYNNGGVTTNISGYFYNVIHVKLTKSGQQDIVSPDTLYHLNNIGYYYLYGVFDLRNKVPGYWNLEVNTLDTTMILPNAFRIDSIINNPYLSSISPNSGINNGHIWTNIRGNFYKVTHVRLTKAGQPDIISPDSLYNINYTVNLINGDFDLLNKAPGYWNLVVMTIDTTMILPNAFRIDTTAVVPGTCSAHFFMQPDSMVAHHYYAINNCIGSGAINYLWNWGDGSTSTGPYPSHTFAAAGWYSICVTITDSTGCTSTYCDSTYMQKSTNTVISVDVIPPESIGIDEMSIKLDISVYPNPVTNFITFETDVNYLQVQVYNINGQMLTDKKLKAGSNTINLTGFPQGLYFYRLTDADRFLQSEKFIKE